MRRLTPLCVLALLLAAAGPAAAKGLESAVICGPSECVTVKQPRALVALDEGGPETAPPARLGGYYEVRLKLAGVPGSGEAFPRIVMPSAGLVRDDDPEAGYAWRPISQAAVREYRRLTRGMPSFPPETLEGLPQRRAAAQPAQAPADDVAVWPWAAGGVVILLLAAAVLRTRTISAPWSGYRGS